MSGIGAAVEYHKDIIGERFYASRNFNQLRHTYAHPAANRSQLDWNLTLRQIRKQKKLDGTVSMPELHTQDLAEARQRVPLAAEHPDGEYHGETETVGKYQNFANTGHMLNGLGRVSSGTSHGIDWQLNLRDGLHQKECNTTSKWKRHFARPQVSFDMMKENCSKENADYQKSQITPQDRRPDRRMGAISIATIRDDPISFRRWPGCEGTEVGTWRHMIEDRERGHKARRSIQMETTLRDQPSDSNGARITDNRSDGCIVEMLGKKKWVGYQSHDSLTQPLHKGGDPKLYHWSRLRILPETDEANRQQRMHRQQRTDKNLPEQHATKGGRSRDRDDNY